jgi:hypothetical protein
VPLRFLTADEARVVTALCERIFPGDAADLAGEAVGPEGGGEREESTPAGDVPPGHGSAYSVDGPMLARYY